MLPESSSVNITFGFTGLRPWIGTSASVSVIGVPRTASGCNASAAPTIAAQLILATDRRLTVIGRGSSERESQAKLLQHGLRVGHGIARAFDTDGDAVERVARPNQSDVMLGAGIGAERSQREIAVARNRGAGVEAHPLDDVTAAIAGVVVRDETRRETGTGATVRVV